jgi:hypothetical protein
MTVVTANPTLNESHFIGLSRPLPMGEAMTIQGAVNKTGLSKSVSAFLW